MPSELSRQQCGIHLPPEKRLPLKTTRAKMAKKNEGVFSMVRGRQIEVSLQDFRRSCGSLAKLVAMRWASSRVSRLVAERRCGAPRCPQVGDKRKSLAHARNDLNDPLRRFSARLRCNAALCSVPLSCGASIDGLIEIEQSRRCRTLHLTHS